MVTLFYYHAVMRVDGILWYHSQARPSSQFYIHIPSMVFHNYGLTLALAGYIVDPDVGYTSVFNITKYKLPIELYRRYGVYVYPAVPITQKVKEVLMAGQGEVIVNVRGRGRLAYPTFTKNVVLMPGSELEMLVISREPLPKKFVVRYGAKRAGTLLVNLKTIEPKIVEYHEVSYPYNINDVVDVKDHVVVLPHKAGDIGALGVASKAYVYEVWRTAEKKQKIAVPALKEGSE